MYKSSLEKDNINRSVFFSLEQFGNIIIVDNWRSEIKIFSNSGNLIHTISNDNLTENEKLSCTEGISDDKQNNIVVAHYNKKCNLTAF